MLKYIEETEDETAKRLSEVLELEKSPAPENKYLWEKINMYRDERTKNLERKMQMMEDGSRFLNLTCVLEFLKSSLGIEGDESHEV